MGKKSKSKLKVIKRTKNHNYGWTDSYSDTEKNDYKCKKKNNGKKVGNSSFMICSEVLLISDETFTELLCFPWSIQDFGSLTNGIIIFSALIQETDYLQVQLYDATNSVDLGTSDIIETTGIYRFPVKNPSSDAQLYVRFRKIVGQGWDPEVKGIILKY